MSQALTAFFDRIAEGYGRSITPAEQQSRRRGLELLNVVAGERIVELGCGIGEDLLRLAQSRADVVGIDASREMAQRSRERLEDARAAGEVQVVDVPPLPLPDGQTHACWSSFTLELQPLEVVQESLSELRRVLSPGGRLGLVSIAATWPDPGGLSLRTASSWQECFLDADSDLIDLKAMVEDVGFDVQRSERFELNGKAGDILLATRAERSPARHLVDEQLRQLGSRQPMDRVRARQRLAMLGAASLGPLHELATSPHEQLRAEATRCLLWIGSTESVDVLIRLLEDSSQQVRWLAAETLVKLDAVPAVCERLTQPVGDSFKLYQAAGRVIRSLVRRGHTDLGVLRDAFEQQEPETSVPVAASQCLHGRT
ncbi:MAG: methyltransferase domain-containing protein [Planctomycetales bacterium]|nr:methyltransferase domain-containing protein [Planctomycetales bacterium]